SITEPFCQYCDRVRITAEGKFYTCLFDSKGYDLKKLIQEGRSDEQIKKYILETISKKPEGIISIIKSNSLKPTLNIMNSIGG
ncbi:MAG: GTP 3',8-cyclase MoaA, partial [Candidatus Nitrosocosmicus sp.]